MAMVECMEDDGPGSREAVMELIAQKETLEREIAQLKDILDLNSVGMNDSLIDAEGYPREDLDVYLIRHTRHKIICLKNDHKALMGRIEAGLHAIHGRRSLGGDSHISMADTPPALTPIARVNLVHPGSPAALSGLEVGDEILAFGRVDESNFGSLKDIGLVVEHSVGQKILIKVQRSENVLRLYLTPRTWAGKGLLGCNILPVQESVDR